MDACDAALCQQRIARWALYCEISGVLVECGRLPELVDYEMAAGAFDLVFLALFSCQPSEVSLALRAVHAEYVVRLSPCRIIIVIIVVVPVFSSLGILVHSVGIGWIPVLIASDGRVSGTSVPTEGVGEGGRERGIAVDAPARSAAVPVFAVRALVLAGVVTSAAVQVVVLFSAVRRPESQVGALRAVLPAVEAKVGIARDIVPAETALQLSIASLLLLLQNLLTVARSG